MFVKNGPSGTTRSGVHLGQATTILDVAASTLEPWMAWHRSCHATHGGLPARR
jgi:hypothetical protein